jgi:outer membrane protein insertion porin family
VSGGFRLYYNKFTAEDANLVDYTNTTYGVRVSSGFPINEVNRLGFSVGWENNGISEMTDHTYFQLDKFWDIYGNHVGSDRTADFQSFDWTARWTRNTLDKGQMATQGMKHSLWYKMTIPGGDLQYFKINFDISNYQRITDDGDWTTLLRASAGYGNGYGKNNGKNQILPFFENYYVGGYRTLRGFSNNTVGPRGVEYDRKTHNRLDPQPTNAASIGGNAKYTLSGEVIFPVPFVDEAYTRSIRTSLFVDAGEVWDTTFEYENYSQTDIPDYSKPGRIRVSTGTQLTWISPMGPLVFTLAVPLKEYEGDRTEIFSFNIGNTF